MNLSVSSELFGKQVKVDVWLTHNVGLPDLRTEIERSLQTKAVLQRPRGHTSSLAIQLGDLQVYDVASYRWVPLVDAEQVGHQSQLYAEVRECTPSTMHISRESERREAPPPSPLTRLPQPKELPKRAGSPAPSGMPSRPGSPARHGSPLRSSSPSKMNSTPRFVPPAVHVFQPVSGGPPATAASSPRPSRASRGPEVGTAWQPEAPRSSFRGYHISDAMSRTSTPQQQQHHTRSHMGSPARTASPVNCREESVQFPLGAEVLVQGEREPLRGQRCRVVGHAAFGKVDVELGTGTTVSISATKLRVVEEGMCALQGTKHDCELSPYRSRSIATTAYTTDPEGFLRDSLSSQARVYSHTLAKHQTMLTEERDKRETAERKVTKLSYSAASALRSLNSHRIMRRTWVAWRDWLGHDRWTLHKGHVSPRSSRQSVSPRGSPTQRADIELQLAELRAVDQQMLAEEKKDFERRFNDKAEKLLQKLEEVKVEMENKEAEIYRERLVSTSLRQKLKDATASGQVSEAGTQVEEPTPPGTPGQIETSQANADEPVEDLEASQESPATRPASPLAYEMSEIQRQLAAAKLENAAVKAENERLRETDSETRAAEGLREAEAEAAEKSHELHRVEEQLRAAEVKILGLMEALDHRSLLGSTQHTQGTSEGYAHSSATAQQQGKTPPSVPVQKGDSVVSTSRGSRTGTAPDKKGSKRKEKEKEKEKEVVAERGRTAQLRGKHSNSPAKQRRRSASIADDGKPLQAYQFPIGAAVSFKDLSGQHNDGWVTNHIGGRVEVQGADGKKHAVLPGRIRERQAASQTPVSQPVSHAVSQSVSHTPMSHPVSQSVSHTPMSHPVSQSVSHTPMSHPVSHTPMSLPVSEGDVLHKDLVESYSQIPKAHTPSTAADMAHDTPVSDMPLPVSAHEEAANSSSASMTPGEEDVVLIHMGPPINVLPQLNVCRESLRCVFAPACDLLINFGAVFSAAFGAVFVAALFARFAARWASLSSTFPLARCSRVLCPLNMGGHPSVPRPPWQRDSPECADGDGAFPRHNLRLQFAAEATRGHWAYHVEPLPCPPVGRQTTLHQAHFDPEADSGGTLCQRHTPP